MSAYPSIIFLGVGGGGESGMYVRVVYYCDIKGYQTRTGNVYNPGLF